MPRLEISHSHPFSSALQYLTCTRSYTCAWHHVRTQTHTHAIICSFTLFYARENMDMQSCLHVDLSTTQERGHANMCLFILSYLRVPTKELKHIIVYNRM